MFGKIIDIDGNNVIIENALHKLEANYVNYHLVFPESDRLIVGEIISMNLDTIKVFLIGEIRNNKFIANVFKQPNFNTKPRIIYKSEVELLLGSQDIDDYNNLLIGKSVIYDNYKITTNISDFFSNHFAILGNTGSGKSCGVARILQNIFMHQNNSMPVNAHMVLFDVYGEYHSALSSINNIPNMAYNYLTTRGREENIINIPAYFLEVDDLALLLNIENNNALPILEKTLKLVYIFKGKSNLMLNYKNNIIASAVLEILSSGRNINQMREQIIAILSRFNTKDINLETQIIQPGYIRTIRQCISIDNQGKMNAVQYVIEHLEKYDKLDLSKIEVDKSITYDLNDLYYALEFALISEGAYKSEKIYDEYNQLKIRLQQIINSDKNEYFKVSETRISKEEYVKRLFSNDGKKIQIVNINLNYVDDRFAKVLTKIYAKIFYDYTVNLPVRCSYPIHIVLEEAHRYVQKDTDIDVLGYNIFERITKEGRKYGVILGLITQRPSDLSSTVLSQCSNFIVFRMFHPDDLKIITSITNSVGTDSIEKVKSLSNGCSLCFGVAFKVPLVAKLELPNPMPKSTSLNVKDGWFLPIKND